MSIGILENSGYNPRRGGPRDAGNVFGEPLASRWREHGPAEYLAGFHFLVGQDGLVKAKPLVGDLPKSPGWEGRGTD
jgi:hypothetical protein